MLREVRGVPSTLWHRWATGTPPNEAGPVGNSNISAGGPLALDGAIMAATKRTTQTMTSNERARSINFLVEWLEANLKARLATEGTEPRRQAIQKLLAIVRAMRAEMPDLSRSTLH